MNCCDNCANHGKTERLEWCSCVDLPRNNGVGCLSWKGKTNYDRIISKTPEELAAQIVEWIEGIDPISGTLYDNDTDGWLDWLKQEATDEA